MTKPNMWLFILEDKEDLSATTQFATLKLEDYEYVTSKYISCKAEMLNNNTSRGLTINVLLFFFKERK